MAKIRIRVQENLVVGCLDNDPGTYVFFVCKEGFEEVIGQPLHRGCDYVVELAGSVIDCIGAARTPIIDK